jgi:type VI secretion system secreted protein Hcp
MQSDIFMKIDDVQGESVDSVHAGEIDVQSWSWGASQSGSSQIGGGMGAGKAMVQDLTFSLNFEKSCPVLTGMLLTGTPFQQAQLTIRKAGVTPLEYIKIIMKGGIISNVSMSGSPTADTQSVTVSLNFGYVEVHYTPQAADGSGGADVTTQYNIAKNKTGS